MTSAFIRPEASATITVTKPVQVAPPRQESAYRYAFEDYSVTEYPAEVVYSEGFELDNQWDGYTTWWSDDVSRTGTESLATQWGGEGIAYDGGAWWTYTGLTIGRTYTLKAWVYADGQGVSARVGVAGKTAPTATPLTMNTWTQIQMTFTATATSHNLEVWATGGTPWSVNSYFDDLTLTRNAYTEVTNNGLGGWVSSAGLAVAPGEGINGGNAMVIFADGEVYIARAFSGLTIGHSYTLRGKQRTENGPWRTVAQTYTAASTAQSFSLTSEQTGEVSYWTDMELIHHVPAVYTNTPSLPISQGKVRLDENYSPYVTANFQVPLTSLELLEQIDPRNPQRVTVTTTEGVSGDTRTFDLGLRSRTVNHGEGTIDIELASDEILLHDRKRVATTADSTARQYETSLRAICSWALGKIGATLAPGTADADMTAAWDATNLQTSPTAGINLTGWLGSEGTASRLTTGTFPTGTGIASAVRVTMNAGATGGPYFNGGDDGSVVGGSLNVSIREKQLYRVSAYVRTSVSKSIRLSIQQRNSANAQPGANLNGPAFTTTANTWHRLTFVFQAYPGAVRAGVYAYLASGTWAAGQTIDITGVMITEGTLDHTFFDGGTIVRTDLYAYTWNGAAQLSSSERRAHVVRRPELFDWTPGQSLFEFLQPLINASGLRLFADENRVFRLVDPADYEVPGYVVAQTGHNAIEGTDNITRDDDTWADAVVVEYRWTDADGVSHSQYDVAGEPNGKTIARVIEREYPGPGAAASILASYEGRGRTQSVTVVGQYLASPGMDVTVNLPGTLTQTGKVRATELDLGSGLNRIETRGLTDALPGSWILWDPDETWSQVDPALKWKDA